MIFNRFNGLPAYIFRELLSVSGRKQLSSHVFTRYVYLGTGYSEYHICPRRHPVESSGPIKCTSLYMYVWYIHFVCYRYPPCPCDTSIIPIRSLVKFSSFTWSPSRLFCRFPMFIICCETRRKPWQKIKEYMHIFEAHPFKIKNQLNCPNFDDFWHIYRTMKFAWELTLKSVILNDLSHFGTKFWNIFPDYAYVISS